MYHTVFNTVLVPYTVSPYGVMCTEITDAVMMVKCTVEISVIRYYCH